MKGDKLQGWDTKHFWMDEPIVTDSLCDSNAWFLIDKEKMKVDWKDWKWTMGTTVKVEPETDIEVAIREAVAMLRGMI